jgi:hypothetical protein
MPLPFSYSGRVEIAGQHDVEGATLRLERGLELLKPKRLDRTGSQIRFKSGAARLVSNTNLLVPIGSGELSVQPNSGGLAVAYRLHFTQILLIATVMVLGFFGPFLLNAPNLTRGEAGVFLFGMWLWLFGGNVVITLIRFPRWIKRTLT